MKGDHLYGGTDTHGCFAIYSYKYFFNPCFRVLMAWDKYRNNLFPPQATRLIPKPRDSLSKPCGLNKSLAFTRRSAVARVDAEYRENFERGKSTRCRRRQTTPGSTKVNGAQHRQNISTIGMVFAGTSSSCRTAPIVPVIVRHAG